MGDLRCPAASMTTFFSLLYAACLVAEAHAQVVLEETRLTTEIHMSDMTNPGRKMQVLRLSKPPPPPKPVCIPVFGFNTVTVGRDHDGDTVAQYANTTDLTVLAAICSTNCNCTAFNNQGALKSSNVTTIDRDPKSFCFYSRDQPANCTRLEFLYNRRVIIRGQPIFSTDFLCLDHRNVSNATKINYAGCNAASLTQIFKVVPSTRYPGYVTLEDVARPMCVSPPVSGDGMTLQFCTGSTKQLYNIQGLIQGGFSITARANAGSCLGGPVPDLQVANTNIAGYTLCNSVLTNLQIEVEPDCDTIPGYTSFLGLDYTNTSSNLRSVTGQTAAQLAAACDDNCLCRSFSTLGVLKTWTADPSDLAAFGVCFYQSTQEAGSCCPDVAGYNVTIGVSVTGSNLASVGNQPRPLLRSQARDNAAACDGDCFCNGVSSYGSGGYLVSSTVPTLFNQSTDTCLYVRNQDDNATMARTCMTDPALYSVDNKVFVTFQDFYVAGRCSGWSVGNGAAGTRVRTTDCATATLSQRFRLDPDGTGYTTIKEIASGSFRCIQAGGVSGVSPSTALGVAECKPGDASQLFLIVKRFIGPQSAANTAEQRYNVISALSNSTQCVENNRGDQDLRLAPCIRSVNAPTTEALQRWTMRPEVQTDCADINGYDVTRNIEGGTTIGGVSGTDVLAFARSCDANCKCNGFNSLGVIKSFSVVPTASADNYNLCFYVKQVNTDCNCPLVDGFTASSSRDRPNDNLLTVPDGFTYGELGARCAADCRCNGFTSKGVLTAGNTPTTTTNNAADCFYAKNASTPCDTTCPTNLACITSKFPATRLPPFSIKLPSIPTPNSNSLLSILDPPTVIGYAASKLPENVTNSISLGTSLIQDLQCGPVMGLPIFTASVINNPLFLGSLSDGSCQYLSLLPNTAYIVGAMSTKAAAFLESLTASKRSSITGAKTGGKDYAVCMAIDPCNLDFHLGINGISATWVVTLGALPPLNVTVTFQTVSFSARGAGAGIQQSAVGLWRYDQGTGVIPDGVPILGNIYVRFQVDLSWGYVVNGQTIATITLQGTIEIVVKFTNPTRFALQTTVQPAVELYKEFKIDFAALAEGIQTAMLFYVEDYAPNNFNVYGGIALNVRLEQVFRALPGPLGAVLTKMISADSTLSVNFNFHINQDGAGVRLYVRGNVGLAKAFADIINFFSPGTPTSFSSGFGVKLSIIPVNGRRKVFGFVQIGGQEFSYGFCSSNSECLNDQVCYLGVCAKQVGCLGSYVRSYRGDQIDGVCPDGVGSKRFSRCYRPCMDRDGKSYTEGSLGANSRICWERCNCGTEAVGTALCSNYFRGVKICNVGTARRRDYYDRTVALVCPPGSDNVLTACYGLCRPNYSKGDGRVGSARLSALSCYVNSCPPEYPKQCSDGTTLTCVKSNVPCAGGSLAALFARC